MIASWVFLKAEYCQNHWNEIAEVMARRLVTSDYFFNGAMSLRLFSCSSPDWCHSRSGCLLRGLLGSSPTGCCIAWWDPTRFYNLLSQDFMRGFFSFFPFFCCLLQIRVQPVDKSDCPPHLFFFRNEVGVHVLLWDVACVEAPRWNCFDKQQVRGIMVWPHGLVCHVMSRVPEKWFCACVCKI